MPRPELANINLSLTPAHLSLLQRSLRHYADSTRRFNTELAYNVMLADALSSEEQLALSLLRELTRLALASSSATTAAALTSSLSQPLNGLGGLSQPLGSTLDRTA